ncbi:MAG: A/G-specific adenine glycosylase [Crocinitomicaceae bacterium]
MIKITGELQKWYHDNKRDLPWRKVNDPYFIWLSEIILQQTQVVQGLAYYEKFTKAYPSVAQLANSTEDHILKNWQGLGYYSRARNLHFAAQQVMSDYGGFFPSTYSEIIKLKGVGEYTAAAISSFAFSEPYAVVDGNVFRVLSRCFAISTPINTNQGKKEFFELAQNLLDHDNPGIHNQAMMELGALVCRPKNPKCEVCPIQFNCEGFKQKNIQNFPVKQKKIKIKDRFLNYLLITDGDSILINKRKGKGIWQGLYDFPLIELTKEVDEIKNFDSVNIKNAALDISLKHILSHQHLYVKFWIVKMKNLKQFSDFEVIKKNELEDFPLPQLIVRYINQSKFFKR